MAQCPGYVNACDLYRWNSALTSTQGLSVGAKAGIGIGVGLSGLAILLVCCFLFKRWKRRNVTSPQHQVPFSKSELEAPTTTSQTTTAQKPELAPAVENISRSELPSDGNFVHELPGSCRQPYEAETPTNGSKTLHSDP